MIKKEFNFNNKEKKMSIESILKDNELELMQSKKLHNKSVYAIDTSLHSAYSSSYMLVIIELDKDCDTMTAYFEDTTDLFYFYDLAI